MTLQEMGTPPRLDSLLMEYANLACFYGVKQAINFLEFLLINAAVRQEDLGEILILLLANVFTRDALINQ